MIFKNVTKRGISAKIKEHKVFMSIALASCFVIFISYHGYKTMGYKMKNNLIKTSHYLDNESVQKLKVLAESNARSLGWTVRKCVEYGLKNADKINFNEAVKFVDEMPPEWSDFFGERK